MKKELLLTTLALLLVALILSACGDASVAAPVAIERQAPAIQPAVVGESAAASAAGETLVDEQGAVTVSVTPLNLGEASATLDFEVALDTHSVELSMDLAQLATLRTDTGLTIPAAAWDAPRGGHHVTGVLTFATSGADQGILKDAASIVLTIENLDASARTFTWNVQ